MAVLARVITDLRAYISRYTDQKDTQWSGICVITIAYILTSRYGLGIGGYMFRGYPSLYTECLPRARYTAYDQGLPLPSSGIVLLDIWAYSSSHGVSSPYTNLCSCHPHGRHLCFSYAFFSPLLIALGCVSYLVTAFDIASTVDISMLCSTITNFPFSYR